MCTQSCPVVAITPCVGLQQVNKDYAEQTAQHKPQEEALNWDPNPPAAEFGPCWSRLDQETSSGKASRIHPHTLKTTKHLRFTTTSEYCHFSPLSALYSYKHRHCKFKKNGTTTTPSKTQKKKEIRKCLVN